MRRRRRNNSSVDERRKSAPGLKIFPARKHRLDVDDGRAVNGFDGANAEAISGDLADYDAMQAERVGTVRGARGKDAMESVPGIRARINLEHVAAGAVQPGDNDDLVAGTEAVEGVGGEGADFKPGVGRALRALHRGL